MAKNEKKASKVDRAYQTFQELSEQGLKQKEIYEKIAEELWISARGYVWRKENPEKYKALLERYFAKKKAKAEKQKKSKVEG